jgi:hypothetical protein
MKIALVKPENPKNQTIIKYTTAANNITRTETAVSINTRKQKVKMGTHLTIIGVCTTICPENSGT